MPWKNGGGITQELFRIPHAVSTDHFFFRLSKATVSSSGEFSLFPGIERTLILLSGHGFHLERKNSDPVIMKDKLSSLQFKGEDSIYCELIDGECVDFNVMIDRTWGETQVSLRVVQKGNPFSWIANEETYLYLDCNDPKLVILHHQEGYRVVAEEDTTIIITEVIRKGDSIERTEEA
jgi:environmental stress-induced protein Ves